MRKLFCSLVSPYKSSVRIKIDPSLSKRFPIYFFLASLSILLRLSVKFRIGSFLSSKWSFNASKLIPQVIVLSPSTPKNNTTPLETSYFSFGFGKSNLRESFIPNTCKIFRTDDISIFFSPFSKREIVGVLTPASFANFSCVMFCSLRLCFASSTIACQLIRNCPSI